VRLDELYRELDQVAAEFARHPPGLEARARLEIAARVLELAELLGLELLDQADAVDVDAPIPFRLVEGGRR